MGITIQKKIFIITALLLISGTIPSFAQSSTSQLITTSIDKSSYTIGDTIVVSGVVQSVVSGTPVSIQILDPNNNVVKIDQTDVSQDGKYIYVTKVVGSYWKLNGFYTVKVQYGPPNVTAQTTFTFQSSSITTSTFQLKDPTNQQIFNVNYAISGGNVKSMIINTQSLAVIISINSTSDGTLMLQLPRTMIDAKTTSGQDAPFAISIDGAEVKPQSESVNTSFRNITVQFLQGDQSIEIIGTQSASGSAFNSSNPYLGCSDCNDTSHIQQIPTTTPIPTPTPQPIQPTISKIPHWVKSIFNLYGQGQVSDDDLISALKFLIQTGVIKVS